MLNDMTAVLEKSEEQPNYKDVDPWILIVESARAMGIKINRPKENCKHCHGRGYIGRHAQSSGYGYHPTDIHALRRRMG